MAKRSRTPWKPSRPHDVRDEPAEIRALLAAGDVDAANRLAELSTETDGAVAKAARKALYLLGARGVRPSYAPAALVAARRALVEPTASTRDAGSAPGAAAMTTSDASGSRLVGIWRTEHAKQATLFLIEEHGALAEIHEVPATTTSFVHEWDSQAQKARAAAALVPIEHAVRRIYAAVATQQRLGRLAPLGLRARMQELGPAPEALVRHPAYDEVTDAGIASPSDAGKNKVHAIHTLALRRWIGPDDQAPWVEKATQLPRSPIVLTPTQQRESVSRLVGAAADALLPEEAINLAIERLEDDALVWRLADRREEAGQALAIARAGRRASRASEWELASDAIKVMITQALYPDGVPDDDGDADEDKYGLGPVDPRIIRVDR